MSIRTRWRALARGAGLALAVGFAVAPFGAAAVQPDDMPAETPIRAGEHAAPVLRAIGPALQGGEPFALAASDAPASYAAKWRDMAFAIEHDRDVLAACRREPKNCPPAAGRFLAMIDAARAKDGRARLGEINRSLNLAIRYRGDMAQHGAPDAWASPLATLAAGAGDCEDYAIAKYLALREIGVAPGDLRLVVVRNARLRQDHAVLAARLGERWLVLDNRTLLLVSADEADHYRALAAFGPEDGPRVAARENMRDGAAPPVKPTPRAPDAS